MIQYLWLLLIPVWIFVCVMIGRVLIIFTLGRNSDKWWSFPLWIALFTPGVIITAAGIFWLGDKAL